MNEKIYRSLCIACDRVLLAADSTIERVSIPWLHIVREHPVLLRNYTEIFDNKRDKKLTFQRSVRLIKNKVWWVYQLGKSIRSDGKLWHGPQNFDHQTDVVLVSHLVNVAHAGLGDDFYFGNLPNDLAKQGHKVVLVLMNHTDQPSGEVAAKWTDSCVPRVVLSDSLTTLDEITLHFKLKKEAIRLRQFGLKELPGLFRRVIDRATEEALSSGAHASLRMSKQIEVLVTKLQPKLFAVTHEGHAWERVSFAAARRGNPSVNCIGYQHAAVFRLQHGLRRKLSGEFNPDHILTAGSVAKCQLENTHGLDGIPVSILGSNRYFKGVSTNTECGVRVMDQFNHSISRVCLVIPEGMPSEYLVLFGFTLRCAQLYPEMQFIWRTHPVLPFKSFKSKISALKNLPENITISQVTIEEDISRSSWVLYRGSTAIVQAVVAGVRSIYLALPEEMTIDPLYEIKNGRKIVYSPEELQKLLSSQCEEGIAKVEYDEIKEYCNTFFIPFDQSALATFIR